jgi:hypothetical protein
MPDFKILLVRAGFRSIAFNPFYARISGVKAGLLLSQAMYWQENVGVDKWFYKTQQEWQSETCLTRTEQESARKTLRRLGLLEEKVAGMPAKIHFRVNLTSLADRLSEFQPAETTQPSMQDSCNQSAGKPQASTQGSRKPYKEAESTTESTSKNIKQERLFELPVWVPLEAWSAYIEMRKKIPRAPLTERAIGMLIEELGRLRDAGEDPIAVLNKATMNSWRSFYPTGNGKQNQKGTNRHEQQFNQVMADRQATREILRRRREGNQPGGLDSRQTVDDIRRDEQADSNTTGDGYDGPGPVGRVIR